VTDAAGNEQEFWDRRADAWEKRADFLDRFSNAYGIPAMDALSLQPGERVMDIGCGPGTTAIELATRVGPDGEVIGVDISPAMLAAATRRAAAAGVTNVSFLTADAQTGTLGHDFDAAYSRFGVMFFADPVTAFANIRGSLHPAGRFGCAVWGPLQDNPWMFVPVLAAGPVLKAELNLPGPNEPGPFSLAERERLSTVLTQAGFVDISIEMVRGSRVITAATSNDDLRAMAEIGPLGEAYGNADTATRQAAVDAIRAAIEQYRDADGWRLPGAALTVLARRP
jgi:SAM-dependent methyltransferase